MPASNPFAPTIEVGGQATAGPASAGLGGSLGLNGAVGDHHAAALLLLLAGGALIFMHVKGKFRFSTTVG